jgi:hypothetical protein
MRVARFAKDEFSCAQNAPAAVAEAKRRLQTTFTFVGVTEDLVASLWLAAKVFGWGDDAVWDALVLPQPGVGVGGKGAFARRWKRQGGQEGDLFPRLDPILT